MSMTIEQRITVLDKAINVLREQYIQYKDADGEDMPYMQRLSATIANLDWLKEGLESQLQPYESKTTDEWHYDFFCGQSDY